MRKSFDGLGGIVQHHCQRDPFDGDVFASARTTDAELADACHPTCKHAHTSPSARRLPPPPSAPHDAPIEPRPTPRPRYPWAEPLRAEEHGNFTLLATGIYRTQRPTLPDGGAGRSRGAYLPRAPDASAAGLASRT